MPNKLRLPESSNTNLFRAAVLLALAPACSMTPAPRVVGEIQGTVNYGYSFTVTEHNRKIIEDRKNDLTPIPDEVKNQVLEISGNTIAARKGHSDDARSSDSDLISAQMTIAPSTKGGGCHVKPITITRQMYDNSDNAETADIILSNADILSNMMDAFGKITISAVTENVSESLKNGEGEHSTDDFRDFAEVAYKHLINGYSIKKGVGGRQNTVELIVQMLECENQRRKGSVDITAEVRAKMARGSKSGNRR